MLILEHSLEQRDLARTVRSVVARCDDSQLLKELAGLGLVGLTVPAERGGADATMTDLALVAAEIGRGLKRSAFVPSALLALHVIEELPGDDAAELTASLIALRQTATVSWLTVAGGGAPTLRIDRQGRAHGTVDRVPWVDAPDVLVAEAEHDDGTLTLVAVAAPAGVVREHAAFDLTEPLASIDLDGVLATDLGAGSNVEQNLRAARIRIRTALAAETVGVGQAVLEGAVEYATTREQFGRAIGSFQSIKHLLVDSYLALDGAEVLSQRAARAVDDDEEDAEHLSRLAMFVATSAAVAAAQNSLQTFGGIGYTWEQGTHRYLRRARARAAQFGRPGVQLAAIADDILVDAGSEPVA